MSNQYELVYVLSVAAGDEAIEAGKEKIKNLLESLGTIDSVEEWGRRKLAYEIQDEKEGFYVVINFSAPAEAPREIERILKISDGLLRYLITRKEA